MLRESFRQARLFQQGFTQVLREQAERPLGSRTVVNEMKQPWVEENMGVRPEGAQSTWYADQIVIDGASVRPGRTPHVESFSTKQRNFHGMHPRQVRAQVEADVRESHAKYDGIVEIRRRGHPLFGLKVRIAKVHLVYDMSKISPSTLELIRDVAQSMRIEVHFQ